MNIFSKKIGGKKGFTLAELLIVIAIIAILTAIAIPAFSASRDKAQHAVYEANARAFHAECMSEYLMDETSAATSATGDYDGVTYAWTLDTDTGVANVDVTDPDNADADISFPFDTRATDATPTPDP